MKHKLLMCIIPRVVLGDGGGVGDVPASTQQPALQVAQLKGHPFH